MTYSQDPPDGSPGQPSFTPYRDGQQPYQPQPPFPAAGPAAYQQAPPGYGYAPPGPPQRRRKRHLVRNILAGAGALAVVIVIAAVIADAGGTHTVTSAGSSGTGTAAKAKSAGNRTAAARIGSSISLTGNTSGEQTAFDTPSAGHRFYAVQFRLADTGTAAYSDSPSNGAQVVDSGGQSYESSLSDVSGCQSFPGTENIAPASAGLGCIVFEVPARAAITEVQFTLDSGMGPQTGQWDVSTRS